MNHENKTRITMGIGERILLFFSRDPSTEDCPEGRGQHWRVDNALSLLTTVYPPFLDLVKDKHVLDIGCGYGTQVVAMAMQGAKKAVGFEIRGRFLDKGSEMASVCNVSDKVLFFDDSAKCPVEKFDMIMSQNSMEHFVQPLLILQEMKSLLAPEGVLLITFAPPWFSPYGSHTSFFTKLPWVNLLFSEKTVMKVRSHYRDDGARRYEEVDGGLNKMSVSKFEQLIGEIGMKIVYQRYDCVKGLHFLGKLPVIRELFVNRITCLLKHV